MAIVAGKFKSKAFYTGALLWVAVFIAISLSAAVAGFVVAVFPPTLAIALGGMIGVGGLFLVALMTPDRAVAPEALIRRLLCLLLFVWVVWPVYVGYKLGPLPALNPTRVLYWMTILLWVFWMVASRTARDQLIARCSRHKLFVWLFLLYFAWDAVCTMASTGPIGSLYFLIKTFSGGTILFFVFLWALRDQSDVERALLWSLAAVVACTALGVAENMRGSNLFVAILPTDPEQLANLSWVTAEHMRNGAYRVSGPFAHPLTFAEYMLMCIPSGAYMAVMGTTRARRMLGMLVLPLAMLSIYLSHTRSSIIGAGMLFILIFASVGIAALRKKNNFFVAIAGAFTLCCVVFAVIAGGALALDLAQGRNRDEQGSTNARFVQLTNGARALAEQPVMGYGPGGAGMAVGYAPGTDALVIDNYYLNVVLDSGVPGLLMYCVIFLIPIVGGLRLGLAGYERINLLSLAIAAGLVAYTMEKIALSLLHNMDFAYVLMAMLLTLHADSKTASPKESRP